MIYDSSVLLVIISPNVSTSEWVDWEIGYALRNATRNGRTSKRNGILCVVQKDRYNSVSWAYDYNGNVYSFYMPRRIRLNMESTYGSQSVIRSRKPDYCIVVSEKNFMINPEKYIEEAYKRSLDEENYPTSVR